MTTLETEPCEGSGQYPLEQVLLDTTPGVNPPGTCPICKVTMTLDGWRLPIHMRDVPYGS